MFLRAPGYGISTETAVAVGQVVGDVGKAAYKANFDVENARLAAAPLPEVKQPVAKQQKPPVRRPKVLDRKKGPKLSTVLGIVAALALVGTTLYLTRKR